MIFPHLPRAAMTEFRIALVFGVVVTFGFTVAGLHAISYSKWLTAVRVGKDHARSP
jgi:hypothetical protein